LDGAVGTSRNQFAISTEHPATGDSRVFDFVGGASRRRFDLWATKPSEDVAEQGTKTGRFCNRAWLEFLTASDFTASLASAREES
jgi:hypothetical protein